MEVSKIHDTWLVLRRSVGFYSLSHVPSDTYDTYVPSQILKYSYDALEFLVLNGLTKGRIDHHFSTL